MVSRLSRVRRRLPCVRYRTRPVARCRRSRARRSRVRRRGRAMRHALAFGGDHLRLSRPSDADERRLVDFVPPSVTPCPGGDVECAHPIADRGPWREPRARWRNDPASGLPCPTTREPDPLAVEPDGVRDGLLRYPLDPRRRRRIRDLEQGARRLTHIDGRREPGRAARENGRDQDRGRAGRQDDRSPHPRGRAGAVPTRPRRAERGAAARRLGAAPLPPQHEARSDPALRLA
jgi:hypothetical protein